MLLSELQEMNKHILMVQNRALISAVLSAVSKKCDNSHLSFYKPYTVLLMILGSCSEEAFFHWCFVSNRGVFLGWSLLHVDKLSMQNTDTSALVLQPTLCVPVQARVNSLPEIILFLTDLNLLRHTN